MADMKVENVSLKDIKPYEKNAKKHPEKQIEYIANSIKEFGWKQPLVLDENGEIIIGHGRYFAAKKLKLDTVPCIYARDLSEQQKKALRLADNKTNESEWDLGLLDIELGDIFDLDMSDFGFDMELEPSADEIDHGGIEDKEKKPVAVKIVFQNTKAWRRVENEVRIFCDSLENVSLSVGEYDDED